MTRIRLVVPFGTLRSMVNDHDADVDSDADLHQINTEVYARFAVCDPTEVQPYLQAAETLGFHAIYDSGDPYDDAVLGTVTITAKGIAE